MYMLGCGGDLYVRGGLYHVETYEDVNNPAGMIEVVYEKGYVSCEYRHYSFLTEGRPFNNRPEHQYDAIGCSLLYGRGK
jgi:hypothetical protein